MSGKRHFIKIKGISMNPIKYFLLTLLVMPILANAVTDAPLTEEEKQYIEWAEQTWNSLKPMTGEIKLDDAVATLNVSDNFYYLSPQDANTVLVDIWGNPPGTKTLGMLFPAGVTPFDNHAWAVTIEYEEDGYVSDEDAEDINYSELLSEMKAQTQAASKERVKQGYPGIELIGWAEKPYYDKSTHKLHWAKEIKLEGVPANTLNYNIRILGRKGVLILNFIAHIEQKELIDNNLDAVLALADFDQGARYSDFNPDIDNVAAYGLGALVAGKAITKTGFLAAALVFLKKFGVIFVAAFAAFFRRIFKRK